MASSTHSHSFDAGNRAGERGTQLVLWITLATMGVEIAAGWWFNSMALLADGWHMSSHAVAIGLSAFAYALARRRASDGRFAFGTWKIEILGGFASALFLIGVALLMITGSTERLLAPRPIAYREAVAVAVLGLLVNVLCALILGRSHSHGEEGGHGHGHGHGHAQEHGHEEAHDHGHGHDHGHDHAQGQERRHHDLNLRSAYLHVLADAATSVLAILALCGGMVFGWAWLDPLMGFAGAVLVAVWALGLVKATSRVLLDAEMDHPLVQEIRDLVAAHPEWGPELRLADLHVWRVGKGRFACILRLEGTVPGLDAEAVHTALAEHTEIVHLTVELR